MTRFFILTFLAACGSSPGSAPDASTDAAHITDASSPFHALPFSGGPDAPVVASAEYRCRDLAFDNNAVVEAEVVLTDPQGPDDLVLYADDHVGMFTADPPSGPEVVLGFSVKAFGLQWERTYDGSTQGWGAFLYQAAEGTSVYTAVCGSATWPIDVLAVDNNGHVTSGMVRATRVADPL